MKYCVPGCITGSERWSRPAALRRPSGTERHSVDPALRHALERSTGAVPLIPDLPPALPAVGRGRHLVPGVAVARRRSAKSRPNRYRRMLHRRYLRECQKGGAGVGATSANEVTLVEATPGARFIAESLKRLIGDNVASR